MTKLIVKYEKNVWLVWKSARSVASKTSLTEMQFILSEFLISYT